MKCRKQQFCNTNFISQCMKVTPERGKTDGVGPTSSPAYFWGRHSHYSARRRKPGRNYQLRTCTRGSREDNRATVCITHPYQSKLGFDVSRESCGNLNRLFLKFSTKCQSAYICEETTWSLGKNYQKVPNHSCPLMPPTRLKPFLIIGIWGRVFRKLLPKLQDKIDLVLWVALASPKNLKTNLERMKPSLSK